MAKTIYWLDGKRILELIESGKDKMHDSLKKLFEFPDWYGRNLDALYDCLTSLHNCEIIIKNHSLLLNSDEKYGALLLETFLDAAKENDDLKLVLDRKIVKS